MRAEEIEATGQKGNIKKKKSLNKWEEMGVEQDPSRWIGTRQEETSCFTGAGEKKEGLETGVGVRVDLE